MSQTGTGNVAGNPAELRPGFSFNGTQLPEGNYVLSFTETAQVCGASTPTTGTERFPQNSFNFTVKCPRTAVTFITRAAFDLNQHVIYFNVAGCGLTDPDVSWNMSLAASISGGATECGRIASNNPFTLNPAGNQPVLQLYAKITGYPYAISSNAAGINLLGADRTTVYSACGQVQADDWNEQPYCFYAPYPVRTSGCYRCGDNASPLPNTSFEFSGGLNGSGTYDGSLPYKRIPLSGWVQPKVGVSQDDLGFDVKISHEKFKNKTIHCDPFSCLPATGLTPDDYHACGGCIIPISKTLHCSIFGKNVILNWKSSSPSYWVGTTTVEMPALGCQGESTSGPVGISIVFNGYKCIQNRESSGITLSYISSLGQFPNPSICSNKYTNMVLGTGYNYKETTSCEPFLVTIDTKWFYQINNVYGSMDVNLTLSE